MQREVFKPATKDEWLRLRTQDLTSTEVSALFGVNPYLTAFELWHSKKSGLVTSLEENERMFWGNILQDAIADGLAKKRNWQVRKKSEYIRLTDHRLGSSFDFELVNEEGAYALLEVKNVDAIQFKQKWEVDDDKNIEAPMHIEFQAQHQMLVSGIPWVNIGALVGGNDVQVLPREKDADVHAAIIAKGAEFWKSIEENRPPTPDFDKDAAFIQSLYAFAEPDSILDARGNGQIEQLAALYKQYGDAAKEAEEKKQGVKAQMLQLINTAEKVVGDRFTISAGNVASTIVPSFERKGFRNFRINWKKEKA